VFRVGNQIKESLRLHRPEKATDTEVIRLLKLVGFRARGAPQGLPAPDVGRDAAAGDDRHGAGLGPKLLVADEPTTALDVTIQAQILELLLELKTRLGMSILLITHNLGIVGDMADRVAVMYAGQVVEPVARTEAVARAAASLYPGVDELRAPAERELGTVQAIPGNVPSLGNFPPGCRFAPRCPMARPACSQAVPELVEVAPGIGCGVRSGRKGGHEPARSQKPAGGIFRSSRVVQPRTAHVKAVDGVSFAIHPARRSGLVGESGCGKTTLGRASSNSWNHGRQRPLRGRRHRPLDRPGTPPVPAQVPDDLPGSLRLVESADDNRPDCGRGLDIHQLAENPAARQQRMLELLGAVGLDAAHAQRYPHEFSGGQRQRIGSPARWRSNRSSWSATKPVSALDVSVQAQIINLLKDLQQQRGLAYCSSRTISRWWSTSATASWSCTLAKSWN